MSTPEPKTPDAFSFPVIGVMHSCFMAKFGVPRQPGLIPEATGYIELQPPFNQPNTVRGLEQFSHLWLCFVFHHNLRDGWKATVRPPRLGGDTRLGVFATRSPFRPSPIGLSVVKLQHLELKDHGIIRIHVQGQDLVDGTPIIDIKPYIPYTDAIPDANAGFAADSPSPTHSPSHSPHTPNSSSRPSNDTDSPPSGHSHSRSSPPTPDPPTRKTLTVPTESSSTASKSSGKWTATTPSSPMSVKPPKINTPFF